MACEGDWSSVFSGESSGSEVSEEGFEEEVSFEDRSNCSLPDIISELRRGREFSAFFLQKSGEHFDIYLLTMDEFSRMAYFKISKPIELPPSLQIDSQFVISEIDLHVLSDFTLHTFVLVDGEIYKRAIKMQYGSNEDGQRMLSLGCSGREAYVQSERHVHSVPCIWEHHFDHTESLGVSDRAFILDERWPKESRHAVWSPAKRFIKFSDSSSDTWEIVETHGAPVLDVSLEYIVLGGETPTLIMYRGEVEKRIPLQFGRDIYKAEIIGRFILAPAERQNESQSIIDLYHVPSDKYYSTPVNWNSGLSILKVCDRRWREEEEVSMP